MDKEVKELLQKIEELGWKVAEEGENIYYLSKYSPYGQDFGIQIEGEFKEDLIDDIFRVYDNFDVSEEAYLWLDETGHGKNGAPYEMKDVINDMEDCEQMILDLYKELIR